MDTTPEKATGSMVQSPSDRDRLRPHLSQMDRLKTQHEWVKGSCGTLIKAPIDYKAANLRVLDAATADGSWLIDAKTILPDDAEFVGFDCTADLFPPAGSVPEQMRLVTQDLLADFPASWSGAFDVVHQRFVLPGFAPEGEAPGIVRRLAGCVRRGGWIQLVEPDATVVVLPCDAQHRAPTLARLPRFLALYMLDTKPAARLQARLAELGFGNVRQQDFDVPVGRAHANAELGARGRKNILYMFRMLTTNFSAEQLGLSQEQFGSLYADAEREIDEYGMSVRYTFTWGQKL